MFVHLIFNKRFEFSLHVKLFLLCLHETRVCASNAKLHLAFEFHCVVELQEYFFAVLVYLPFRQFSQHILNERFTRREVEIARYYTSTINILTLNFCR